MKPIKLAETWIAPTVSLREAEIGQQCELLANSRVKYSHLGGFSYIGEQCTIADARIGKIVAIANHVRIGAPNHPMTRPSQHRITYCPVYYSSAAQRDTAFFSHRRSDIVTIGNDVWIGHAAIVLPGVTIGDGAVIAASKHVAPYNIVGGVPAKLIRQRLTGGLVTVMQRIAWWDWPLATIIERLADFQQDDEDAIARFCQKWDNAEMS
ncbi:MAG: Virginiamycin A acetyltransferase [Candidatus Erwinia impunctatus]|nr:Virginiamycin A acetyltransferase [Culicoides impunctatus]